MRSFVYAIHQDSMSKLGRILQLAETGWGQTPPLGAAFSIDPRDLCESAPVDGMALDGITDRR
jgi:hypothetical protein